MAKFRTLDDFDPQGKRVLLRADLNVPIANGKVADATRIDRLAPTIDELARRGARVIVMSHFGRPKDREPDLSLRPTVPALAAALGGRRVVFAEDCIGAPAEKAVHGLRDGEIAVLENLRFHKGEEQNDPAFARALASLGDVYVDDAFSVAHRAHASTDAVAHLLPAYAGRLMQAELIALDRALDNPTRPVAAIVGGAKVATKLDLLANLVTKVQFLIIGGAMANTLLLAEGRSVGKSLVERDMIETARGLGAKAKAAGCELLLPVDAVVAGELKTGVPTEIVAVDRVPANAMILDIGPRSVVLIGERLASCRTLVWNGPVGAFETKPFDKATLAIAKQVAALTRAHRLVSIAGGGDTVAALHEAGVVDDLTYVSTAGGAFLEWLEGKTLPGLKALETAER
ncbi:MAG: phosphoglycerate kinase [Alphaproteobacteria bacterium]|nr:phosphoglycerate kinase [Alphaproteobacteria bacterium]